jgi:hypothetical protein
MINEDISCFCCLKIKKLLKLAAPLTPAYSTPAGNHCIKRTIGFVRPALMLKNTILLAEQHLFKTLNPVLFNNAVDTVYNDHPWITKIMAVCDVVQRSVV